jgi:uncharacterized protein YcaQ
VTTVHELSRQDARRIAVRAQLLDADRPTDLQDVVRHLPMLQVDHVQAVAPCADLVAWSRLGWALLSPLDRLVFDRRRMREIFAFDYQLEMYKPKAFRRWGYYALPVLHGDRLVGKVDATADRKAGVLRVDAVHEDAPFDEANSAAVRGEIEQLAQWLELDLALPR